MYYKYWRVFYDSAFGLVKRRCLHILSIFDTSMFCTILFMSVILLKFSIFSEWSYSVTGVEGNVVELPCNASSSQEKDDVKLVLWFKNGSNKPIYTYDNRDGSHSHWSDDFVLRGRALFALAQNEAKLAVRNVNYGDQSVYKCRVDFKKAPTSISVITFNVIGKLKCVSQFLMSCGFSFYQES